MLTVADMIAHFAVGWLLREGVLPLHARALGVLVLAELEIAPVPDVLYVIRYRNDEGNWAATVIRNLPPASRHRFTLDIAQMRSAAHASPLDVSYETCTGD